MQELFYKYYINAKCQIPVPYCSKLHIAPIPSSAPCPTTVTHTKRSISTTNTVVVV